MTVNFGGVDSDAYQNMLSELYDEAVKKFTSLGYTVLTADEVKGKLPDAVTFNQPGKAEKMVSGTVTGVSIRPKGKLLCPAKSSYGSFYNKVAKSTDAMVFRANLAIQSVDFGRGSRFSKKASVNASPGLSIGGFCGATSSDVRGNCAIYVKQAGRGTEDWVGPKGLYETSKNDMPWLGSSKGKYTIDIDQEKYLAAVKSLASETLMKSIDNFHSAVKK